MAVDAKNYIISMQATLKGTNVVISGLKSIEGETKKFSQTVNLTGKKTQDFSDILIKAGQRALVVAPIWLAIRSAMMLVLRTFTEMVQTNIKFESSMAEVQGQLQGTGEEIEAQMAIAKSTILDMSANSRVALNDLADAFRFLKSANLSFQETMAGFPIASSLMNAFGLSAQEASRAVAGMATTARKSFGEQITLQEKFTKIGDVLAYTYVKQDVLVGELIASYAKFAPYISAVDDNFTDIVTTLGFLNTQMLRSSRTGTLTARALVQMTGQADKLASAFGITFDMQKPLNFLNVIEELYNRIGSGAKITAEQTAKLQEVFGLRASVAVNLLVSNFDKLQESLIDARENADGFLKNIERIRMGTLEAQSKRLSNVLAVLSNDFISGVYGAGDFAGAMAVLNDTLASDEMRNSLNNIGLSIGYIGEQLGRSALHWKLLLTGQRELRKFAPNVRGITDYINEQEKSRKTAEKDAEVRKKLKEQEQEAQDLIINNEKIYRDEVKTTSEILKLFGASELDIAKQRVEEFNKANQKLEEMAVIEQKLKTIEELSAVADKEQTEIFKVQKLLLEGQLSSLQSVTTERDRYTKQAEYDLANAQAQNDLLVQQVKYRKEIVETYQKASSQLLQVVGISESKILAIQLEQLEANKENMGIESFLSQQKQLQLALAVQILKEKQKELQIHNNLLLAYEKGDATEKTRLRRVVELRKLSDSELAKQFETNAYDKQLILDYWNYFSKTGQDAIAITIGDKADLPFEIQKQDTVSYSDIPEDVRDILSGRKFADNLLNSATEFAKRFQAFAEGNFPTKIIPTGEEGLTKFAPITEIKTLIDKIEVILPADALNNVATEAGKKLTNELLNNEQLQKALAHLLRPHI